MIRGSRLSAAALVPRMRAQEVIANNLANLQTVGFRRERVAFHRVLENAARESAGQVLTSRMDDQSAEFSATGHPLDFAIDGPGYFVVRTPAGERYTRAGGFARDTNGLLATSRGHPVLGDGGELTLPAGEVSVAEDGSIRAGNATLGRLRVVSVDAADLVPEGEGLFALRDGAAPAEMSPATRVRQGFLDGSNVVPVSEMVEMLAIFRDYETNFRAMQVQGETLQKLIEQQMR